jgi:glucose/arabinose dehydrogenase
MASGLTSPTAFAFTPDGRAFIAEKNGIVRVFKGGQVLGTPLVDMRDQVNAYWDRGLIGIAVHPQFATNGYVYLLHAFENNAADPQGRKVSRLTRLTVSGDTAARSTQTTILDNIPSEWYGHSIGNVKFASDGSIFLTAGDAATWNQVTDDALRAQSVDSLAGKVIRISQSGAGLPDNPYWDGNAASVRSKVWARGLRNGFRFNLQPGTDIPYVGDVGWSSWEEIDVATKGANFGWPCYEGNARQAGYEPRATCQSLYAQGAAAVKAPLQTWANAGGAAATGGAFYSGTTWPAQYRGMFFYADYVKSWLRATATTGGTPVSFATNAGGPVAMEAGPDSNLWYLAIATGQLRQLRYGAAPPPPPPADGESFLSDATPLSAVNGYGPWEKDRSNNNQVAGDGNPLTLAGVTYAKGLGVHAESALRYSLGGRCSRLTAKVGVDDEVWSNGSVTFEVWGDGTKLYDSGRMTGTSPTATVDVALTGRSELRLVVTGAGDGIAYDHGDWADARLTCGAAPAGSAPVPTITSPASSVRFKVGDTITFAGGATDAEDGTIPASGLSWQITLQHCSAGNCHAHPLTTATGAGGSFQVPDHGDQIEFTLALTATDSSGRRTTTTHTVLPQLVQMTLATSPTGLDIVNGGERAVAPMVRTVVAGSKHTILAPSPQGDRTFSSWSDGGAAQHDVTVGTSDVTYTATYGGTADTTPPTVSGIEPAAGATGVATTANVTATFSEAMQAGSITDATVRLTPQGSSTAVPAAVTYDATTRRATLDPTAALASGTAYTARVVSGSAGVKDAAATRWPPTGRGRSPRPRRLGRQPAEQHRPRGGRRRHPLSACGGGDAGRVDVCGGVRGVCGGGGEPARRFVWKYTPNGSGGYTRPGWRGRPMGRRAVMGRPARCAVMAGRRRAPGLGGSPGWRSMRRPGVHRRELLAAGARDLGGGDDPDRRRRPGGGERALRPGLRRDDEFGAGGRQAQPPLAVVSGDRWRRGVVDDGGRHRHAMRFPDVRLRGRRAGFKRAAASARRGRRRPRGRDLFG